MQTFRQVVLRGGFAAAARELDLSNAAVSKHVKDLESLLQTTLLVRTTRRVALTEAGQVFLDRANDILDAMEDAERAVTSLASAPRGRLRVNAPMSFGLLHVAPLVPAFQESYPDIEVDLSLNDRFVDLVQEGFDVGLRIRNQLEDSAFIARRISAIETALVASPDYIARYGSPAAPDDLAAHRLLVYSLNEDPHRWTFRQREKVIEVPVNPYIRANAGLALLAPALAGSGLLLTPTFTIGDALRTGALVRLLEDWQTPSYSLFALYAPSRHLTPKVRVFIDFIAARLAPTPWG